MLKLPNRGYSGLIGFLKFTNLLLYLVPEVLQLFSAKLCLFIFTRPIDPNGRFIILTGHINSLPVTGVNIYEPNTDDPAFFHKVFDLIPDDDMSHTLIGGDFNCYLDSDLDRVSAVSPPNILTPQTLNNLTNSKKLVDLRRTQHPSNRDYSLYSHVHKSHAQIDYFLVDFRLISNIIHTKYRNIIISDNSPVSLSLHLSLPRQAYSWRFNPFLLSDQVFKEYILKHISVS